MVRSSDSDRKRNGRDGEGALGGTLSEFGRDTVFEYDAAFLSRGINPAPFRLLMDAEGHWSLAPFYDFTYSDGPNGWQTLSVAGVGENPTQKDLDRLAKEVGL